VLVYYKTKEQQATTFMTEAGLFLVPRPQLLF
jgi:hypothetical protein